MNRCYAMLWFACIPATALAQFNFSEQAGTGETSYRPTPLFSADFCFTQHHASTASEGFLRGSAAWIHAKGSYLVNERQAAISNQAVRRLDLLNDYCRAEFNDWKRERRERRLESRREANLQSQLEKYRAAYELTNDEFDRSNGTIYWPAALRGLDCELQRRKLDELFRRQAGYDLPTPSDAREIERECERLSRESTRNQQLVSTSEFRAAQRFLRGLKYEPLFRAQAF